MKVLFAKYTNLVPLRFGRVRQIRDSHKCGGCYRKTTKSTSARHVRRETRRARESAGAFHFSDSWRLGWCGCLVYNPLLFFLFFIFFLKLNQWYKSSYFFLKQIGDCGGTNFTIVTTIYLAEDLCIRCIIIEESLFSDCTNYDFVRHIFNRFVWQICCESKFVVRGKYYRRSRIKKVKQNPYFLLIF
jgi:hypothetical protein